MKHFLLALTLPLLQLSCSDLGTGLKERQFDILFRYGISARNELNTFDGTFTKDLILDSTRTTSFVLSETELDSIAEDLSAADIFSYPDTFVVQTGDTAVFITPHQTYILKIRQGNTWKEVYWEDSLIAPDPRAGRLRQTFNAIRALVESKPEYKKLPPARGGYL